MKKLVKLHNPESYKSVYINPEFVEAIAPDNLGIGSWLTVSGRFHHVTAEPDAVFAAVAPYLEEQTA